MYRLFVLGAGFSRYAGLPLGSELLAPILQEARNIGFSELIERDIENFRQHQRWSRNDLKEIDLESFISFLDIVHFLKLEGKERWSSKGSKTQLIIRNLIARILYRQQLKMSNKAIKLYDDFVTKLHPTDRIITFNYDTIIEEAMIRNNVSFRLFPQKLKSASKYGGIVDTDAKEIVLLKMHGSLNWFDRSDYDELMEERLKDNFTTPPHWSIFPKPEFNFQPLLTGAYLSTDPLSKITITHNMKEYIERDDMLLHSPYIVSPSLSKIVYLNPLTEFWNSFHGEGTYNPEVIFIGFSFPDHDEYLRIPLFELIDNFQNYNRVGDLRNPHIVSKNLKIIDFQKSPGAQDQFKQRLPVVNWEKTNSIWSGFSPDTIDSIFE